MKKSKESSDLIPFDYISDDYAVTAYGDVVFALKIEMVEAYTMADNTGGEDNEEASSVNLFYHDYKSALNKLEEGVIVQKITEVYTLPHSRNASGTSKTKRWNEDMFIQRDIVFENTYLLVLFPFRRNKKKSLLSPITERVERFKGIEYIEDYVTQFESFSSSLSSVCKEIEGLKGGEVLDLYSKTWNLGKKSDYLDPISVDDRGMMIGSKNVSVLTSAKLPSTFEGFSKMNRSISESKKINNGTNYRADVQLPTSYLFPLGLGMPFNHFLIETIRIEYKEEIETRLPKERQQLNFLVGLKMPDAIKKRDIIDNFIDQKSTWNYKYASWGVTLLLYSDDKDELANMVNLMTDKASKELGLVLAVQNMKSFKSFYAALPGCARISDNLRLTYLEVCSYMTHIESFKKGNSSGVVLVDLFGRPFVFDFWDKSNKYVESRNGVIYAPTGQGKSFMVNHLLDQSYHNGDVIFLIDVGGSYKRITALNNGTYIDSKKVENLKFNPFLDCYQKDGKYYPDLDERGNKDSMYIDYMATLLMSCYGKDESKGVLGSVDVLKRSIKQYFDLINNQGIEVNFNTYYEFLEKSFFPNNKDFDAFLNYQEFLLIMEKYKSSGQFGFLLNNDESFNLKSRWITFDLVGVVSNEDLASPTLLMVMYLFEKMKAIHYGNNVRMFIEEAVDFLQGGVFSDYIGGLYRKIRKYGGQVFIVTQSINFLDKLDPLVKDSIQENSEIKILLNHAKVSYLYDKLEKNLSLSKSEVELIKNQTPLEDSKYRIGFMKFGSMPGFLFRHEVSPETYSLYQTNADEIKKIDSLIEQMGSISGAVNTYVEQLNS